MVVAALGRKRVLRDPDRYRLGRVGLAARRESRTDASVTWSVATHKRRLPAALIRRTDSLGVAERRDLRLSRHVRSRGSVEQDIEHHVVSVGVISDEIQLDGTTASLHVQRRRVNFPRRGLIHGRWRWRRWRRWWRRRWWRECADLRLRVPVASLGHAHLHIAVVAVHGVVVPDHHGTAVVVDRHALVTAVPDLSGLAVLRDDLATAVHHDLARCTYGRTGTDDRLGHRVLGEHAVDLLPSVASLRRDLGLDDLGLSGGLGHGADALERQLWHSHTDRDRLTIHDDVLEPLALLLAAEQVAAELVEGHVVALAAYRVSHTIGFPHVAAPEAGLNQPPAGLAGVELAKRRKANLALNRPGSLDLDLSRRGRRVTKEKLEAPVVAEHTLRLDLDICLRQRRTRLGQRRGSGLGERERDHEGHERDDQPLRVGSNGHISSPPRGRE